MWFFFTNIVYRIYVFISNLQAGSRVYSKNILKTDMRESINKRQPKGDIYLPTAGVGVWNILYFIYELHNYEFILVFVSILISLREF